MAEITIESAPQKVRDLFNRGFAALERGNLDYAIDLLSSCVEIEPAALRARKMLRAAQIKKFRNAKASPVAAAVTMVKTLPLVVSTILQIRSGKAAQALSNAEKLLKLDPLNGRFAVLAANAALLLDLPEAAVMTLELTREHRPDDVRVLKRLAEIHAETGDTKAARDCFEHLTELHPNVPEYVKGFKDAMARHSMARDGWEQAAAKGGTFREAMRNTGEAVQLEREAKAVKTDRDADSLIADTLTKLQAEPENMNYYRSLARLYTQKSQFEEAIATVEEALQRNPGDPELEQQLSVIRQQQMDQEIAQLRAAGNEDAATGKEAEKAQFVLADLEDRVHRYPNDLRLRYDWGAALFQAGRINDSIQQFQAAQRSPKHRTRALYHLALCFKDKNQYDLAAQQLTAAAADLVTMDATKKDILYELGALHELMGNQEEALRFFKEIYQADIGFRDVSAKVEQMYRN